MDLPEQTTTESDAGSDADLVRLLDRFADAWNRHDLDALMSMMTDDCVFEASAGAEVDGQKSEGKQAVRAAYAAVFEAFPDVRVSVDSIGAEGDRVWVRITMRGTQLGPYMGVPPTGKTFEATTVNEVRIENGMLAEEWGVTDTLAMMLQLGLA